jgi:hypothetical protein
MRKGLLVIAVSLILIPGAVNAGKKKGQPKNMRVYAAECSDVIGPLRRLFEERDFFIVDEDVDDDGDIEMELARRGGFGKRSKARGWVELNQGANRCTVIVELHQKNPVSGGWQDMMWKEDKFYASLDEQFPQVE